MCNIMFREYVRLISHQIRDKGLTIILVCLIHMKLGVLLIFYFILYLDGMLATPCMIYDLMRCFFTYIGKNIVWK